ncbi:Zn-ribbon domain-containing OB-fold protein [Rhodococcus sp. NPDC057529]|uniref:Zn-ribbon domain-containing OB-fold protein n=1 Tax=Rhodococcus sp. NPDC057529 TaxID=3346158 RepID=UPI00367362F9
MADQRPEVLRQRDADRPELGPDRGGSMTARVADRTQVTTRTGQLIIWKCRDCAALLAPLTRYCSYCGSDELEQVPSAGTGVIVSWRAVDRAPDQVCGLPNPSIVAIVALDEGPWVYSWIDCDAPLPTGQPVRVWFRHTRPGERFPVFEPHAGPTKTRLRRAGKQCLTSSLTSRRT